MMKRGAGIVSQGRRPKSLDMDAADAMADVKGPSYGFREDDAPVGEVPPDGLADFFATQWHQQEAPSRARVGDLWTSPTDAAMLRLTAKGWVQVG